ncbi:hypothetical protein BKA64DRAFT_458288 [Cadophora sp. MPI-SDFR-AT-0126]|nr:hypothetical protein BKA64DRAFT_458288 [Leotiomycetes sp. MPI-SDFR-AT-0126]
MWNFVIMMIALLRLTFALPTSEQAEENLISLAQNTTQTFRLRMKVTHGDRKYNNWVLQTYHIGAALSVVVFTNPSKDEGPTLVLSNTQLQIDGPNFPFSMNAPDMVSGHSRWLEVYFELGDGTERFGDYGSSGIVIDRSSFDGWLVCES